VGKRLTVFFVVLAAAVAAAVLFTRPPGRPPMTRLAVASIRPIADIASNVAGERFEVRCLLPPGASPHTFEPTTQQIVDLSSAQLFLEVGLDLEMWAPALVKSAANPGLKIVTVSAGITPARFGDHGGERAAEGAGDAAGEEHGLWDPHVWMDPVLALRIVENVRAAFAEADPEGAAGYAERAAAYSAKLRELDADYARVIAALPVKKVVAFHDAYAYMAGRYGIEIVGVVEEAPGKEPGARHIQELIRRIRTSGAGAVMVEPQFSPRMAESIARDAGVRVATIDPIGDESDPRRSTYLDMMRFNLESIRTAGTPEGAR